MWIGITRTDGSAKHSRSNELTKGCEYYAEPIRISTVCRSGYVIMHHTAFRRADQPKRARQSHLGDGGLLLQSLLIRIQQGLSRWIRGWPERLRVPDLLGNVPSV